MRLLVAVNIVSHKIFSWRRHVEALWIFQGATHVCQTSAPVMRHGFMTELKIFVVPCRWLVFVNELDTVVTSAKNTFGHCIKPRVFCTHLFGNPGNRIPQRLAYLHAHGSVFVSRRVGGLGCVYLFWQPGSFVGRAHLCGRDQHLGILEFRQGGHS